MSLKSLSLLEVEAIIHVATQLYPPNEVDQPVTAGSLANYEVHTRPLVRILESLTKAKFAELIALMWLGRGDSGEKASDWDSLLRNAVGYEPTYVVSKKPLVKYLEDGLAKLGVEEDQRLPIH